MGTRGLVPLSLIAALALSGCAAFDAPSPDASCAPRLFVDGAPYRPSDGTFTSITVDGEPDVVAGDPVPGAEYAGCDDGGGLTGGGPTEAWRAEGIGDGYILTMTLCARMEGSEAAADCDPDALPYLIWEPDVAASPSPS